MSDENDPRNDRPHKSRWIAFIAVLALLVGALAYLVYDRQVNVRGALELLKEGSEEAATTASVKTALALSRRVSAFDINVDTQGGVVRLEGTVPSEEVREIAVAIARDTAGVESVEDRLLIDPEARPSEEIARLKDRIRDLEIQTALTSALSHAPDLSSRNLSTAVADGTVTLEGTVEDSAEKQGAERIASSIEGVVDVVSHLEVSSPREATAAESENGLAKRAEFALFATDAFDLERIHLRVEDGVATLTGEVRSQAERLLAERVVADVEGIDRVDNQLEVLAVFREA